MGDWRPSRREVDRDGSVIGDLVGGRWIEMGP